MDDESTTYSEREQVLTYCLFLAVMSYFRQSAEIAFCFRSLVRGIIGFLNVDAQYKLLLWYEFVYV